ncbi:MAG TPA: hypothetical protein VMD28_02240 [Acidimicrobiales bacterium]|nr:hypothetical protein [Acidimicrobiales bacterium]
MLNVVVVVSIALTMGALLEVVRRSYQMSHRGHLSRPPTSRRRRSSVGGGRT